MARSVGRGFEKRAEAARLFPRCGVRSVAAGGWQGRLWIVHRRVSVMGGGPLPCLPKGNKKPLRFGTGGAKVVITIRPLAVRA